MNPSSVYHRCGCAHIAKPHTAQQRRFNLSRGGEPKSSVPSNSASSRVMSNASCCTHPSRVNQRCETAHSILWQTWHVGNIYFLVKRSGGNLGAAGSPKPAAVLTASSYASRHSLVETV